MHVGEKPYVVTATGHAELAANALTIPAMTGMLDQLLPVDTRQALDELGAVEYQLPSQPGFAPDARYSVVAARGGDDIWIEVRRKKVEQPDPVPQPAAAIAVAIAATESYTLETSGPIVVDDPAPVKTADLEREPTLHKVSIEAPAVSSEPIRASAPALATTPDPADAIDEIPVVTSEELEIITSEDLQAFGFDNPASFQFGEPAVVMREEPVSEPVCNLTPQSETLESPAADEPQQLSTEPEPDPEPQAAAPDEPVLDFVADPVPASESEAVAASEPEGVAASEPEAVRPSDPASDPAVAAFER